MYRKMMILSLILVLLLMACQNDPDDETLSTAPTPAMTPTATTGAVTSATMATFTGQNTINVADGSKVTYAFSLDYPSDWAAVPGDVTNFLNSRDPMAFPMKSGDVQISFSFRAFLPPDMLTLEQALFGAPNTPITLAGYAGLRSDFSDEAATHSEGSTIVLQLDDDAFVFITVQTAYGERATLEPAALEILNSLSVNR